MRELERMRNYMAGVKDEGMKEKQEMERIKAAMTGGKVEGGNRSKR